MNCYGSLAQAREVVGTVGTTEDPHLLRLLIAASRAADSVTSREFFSRIATVYFDGPAAHCDRSKLWFWHEDVLTITGLTVDDDGDWSYGTTFVEGTDYVLWPWNRNGTPARRADMHPNTPQLASWPIHGRAVKVVGRVGYSDTTEASGTLAEDLDSSETGVDMTAGHGLTGGETIRVESEDMYVSAVSTNTLTVTRAINGTTAAAHTNGAAVTRRTFPGELTEAVCQAVARLWREGRTGQTGAAGGGDIGGFPTGLPFPIVRQMSREIGHLRMPGAVI